MRCFFVLFFGFFGRDFKRAVFRVDDYYVAFVKVARKYDSGNRRFDVAFDETLQRSCAERYVVAAVDNDIFCRICNFKVQILPFKS